MNRPYTALSFFYSYQKKDVKTNVFTSFLIC